MNNSFNPLRALTAVLLLFVLAVGQQGFGGRLFALEATLPLSVQTEETYANTLLPQAGHFPTQSEAPLLRGPSNSRSLRGEGGPMGPDLQMQSATGIFPYEDPDANIYRRNPNLFRNMDHLLGFLTPNDAWTIESKEVRHAALTLDANTSILTRTFSPDLAMLKAGPLFFDLLWLEAGVVWSDYNGPQNFGPGNGDGVTSYVGTGFRGLVRLTDTIYLSAAGNVMYLPQENKVAFGLGYGTQNSLAVDLYFADTWGAWDVSATNSFVGRPGLNFYANTYENGVDQAGRYWFGIQQSRANQFAQNNSAFFSNTVALNASRLVMGGSWRFWSSVRHVDFWRSFDFTGHSQREQLSLALAYEGSILPFAPRLSYDAFTFNKFKTLWHQLYLGLTGRITENVTWTGGFGYLFTTGQGPSQDRFLWQLGLTHNITSRTTHGISIGESFFYNDYSSDALTARYARYSLDHSFARNLRLGFFAQISDSENSVAGNNRSVPAATSRAGGGVTLAYRPLDFTSINLAVIHDESITAVSPYSNWITQMSITQQLSKRLTGTLMYQYQDARALQSSFTEHMIQFRLRRYF